MILRPLKMKNILFSKKVYIFVILLVFNLDCISLIIDPYQIRSFNQTTFSSEKYDKKTNDLSQYPFISLHHYKQEKSLSLLSLVSHSPIAIKGDNDFANQSSIEGWLGNGTYKNPYIIQNYFIDGYSGIGINISDTRCYFVVQNTWVNGTKGFFPKGTGFFLNNVTNGLLNNNTASFNSDSGFHLQNSNSTKLTNNYALLNKFGFYLHPSHYIILDNNTSKDNNYNAFIISASFSTTLTNNKATGQNSCYYVAQSNYTTLENNFATKCGTGFFISQTWYNFLFNNTSNESLNDGFLVHIGYKLSILNNTASNNFKNGFNFEVGGNSTVFYNNAYNNFQVGFFLNSESFDNLTHNVASNNMVGFEIYYSSFNLLKINNAVNNEAGIAIDGLSIGNIIVGNNLENSIHNGFDATPRQADLRDSYNWWIGNSYSDYNGNGFYIIGGSALAIDSNPQYPITDSDNDGMPDWFEKKYSLNVTINDSNEDPDNDGLTNYQEYLLKKDPRTPDSDNIIKTTTIVIINTSEIKLIETTTIFVSSNSTETVLLSTILTSQILETITKSVEGFTLIVILLGFTGVLIKRRKM